MECHSWPEATLWAADPAAQRGETYHMRYVDEDIREIVDYKCWKSKVSTKSKTFSLDYKCWKSKVSESKTFTMDFEC